MQETARQLRERAMMRLVTRYRAIVPALAAMQAHACTYTNARIADAPYARVFVAQDTAWFA